MGAQHFRVEQLDLVLCWVAPAFTFAWCSVVGALVPWVMNWEISVHSLSSSRFDETPGLTDQPLDPTFIHSCIYMALFIQAAGGAQLATSTEDQRGVETGRILMVSGIIFQMGQYSSPSPHCYVIS